MQINKLSDLLKGVKIDKHDLSLPKAVATPKTEQSKILSIPVRTPINKQAALLMRPIRCWLSQPIHETKASVTHSQYQAVIAQLKIERNEHALTRDKLGETRIELRNTKKTVQLLQREIEKLDYLCCKREETIRQLEDLKL